MVLIGVEVPECALQTATAKETAKPTLGVELEFCAIATS